MVEREIGPPSPPSGAIPLCPTEMQNTAFRRCFYFIQLPPILRVCGFNDAHPVLRLTDKHFELGRPFLLVLHEPHILTQLIMGLVEVRFCFLSATECSKIHCDLLNT